MTCPLSPNCPYCDDDGVWEREIEAAEALALALAHSRPPEPDDFIFATGSAEQLDRIIGGSL